MSDGAIQSEDNAVRDGKGQWLVPPVSPGRPKGSRNRLGEDFLKAMADDFEVHGAAAIQNVRETRPQDYLKVVASILPKIISVKSDELENQTDDELRAAYAREVRKLIAFGVAVGIEVAPQLNGPAGPEPAEVLSPVH